MKICFVAPYFYSNRGGPEYYLCREFSKLGSEVVFLTSDRCSFPKNIVYPAGWQDFENFKVYRIKSLFDIHQAPFLSVSKKLLKEIDPDIVYTLEYFQPISISISKACEELKIPFVFYQHAYKYPEGTFGAAFKIYDRMIRKYVWKKTKHAIAISNAAKQFLLKLGYKKPIGTMVGGVDTEIFKPMKKGFLRKKLNIDEDTFLVLSVSRLCKEKGVLKIPIFAKKTKDLNIHYVVVGNGPLKEEFLEMSNGLDNIDVIEFVPHSEMPKVYSDADLCIAPSDVEVLNFTVLEAMACGTPVLASRVGGMKDIVNKNVGALLPKDDIPLWIRTIREFYGGDCLETRNIINQAKKFDWKLLAKNILENTWDGSYG
jgi:glycosyltransferase involved in cell wall biosynthesis